MVHTKSIMGNNNFKIYFHSLRSITLHSHYKKLILDIKKVDSTTKCYGKKKALERVSHWPNKDSVICVTIPLLLTRYGLKETFHTT